LETMVKSTDSMMDINGRHYNDKFNSKKGRDGKLDAALVTVYLMTLKLPGKVLSVDNTLICAMSALLRSMIKSMPLKELT
jgi:hypothetical protein